MVPFSFQASSLSKDADCKKVVTDRCDDSESGSEEANVRDLPSQWFPCNHPGYELFPEGFPDVHQLRVNKVSTKSLDFSKLRETKEKLKPYLTEAASTWWDTTLEQLDLQDRASCDTCRKLREEQRKNCASKKDDDATRKEKARLARQVDKEFLQHLQDESQSDKHPVYGSSSLLPPSRFSWIDGGYVDSKPQSVQLTPDEATLVGTLHAHRQESEDHFVGITASANRSGSTNPRLATIQPGHIVIVRLDADKESGCPFYVGEVLSCDNTAEGNFESDDTELSICEYGRRGGLDGQDPGDVRWQAIFRGSELVGGRQQERDEFKLDASSKPSTSSFRPLEKRIWMSMIAEFDTPQKMLTAPPRKKPANGSRKLQSWVKTVLHNNPRVNWEKPLRGQKRKQSGSDSGSSKRGRT